MSQTKRSRKSRDFATVNPAAAAIDIGATIHVAAVGPNRDKEPVRTFHTFTDDLYRLADWFAGCGIRTVLSPLPPRLSPLPPRRLIFLPSVRVLAMTGYRSRYCPGREIPFCENRNSPGPERGRLDHQASCGQGMLVLSVTIELAEILIDMTSAARFEGVGGSRSAQPVLEGRTNCAAAGARGAHCRVGAPSWVE